MIKSSLMSKNHYSIYISKDVMKEFQKKCIDDEKSVSDAVEEFMKKKVKE